MENSTDSVVGLKAPVTDESLITNKEKIILLRNSKLHGCVFPPWQGPPASNEFDEDFVDSTDFKLSEEQQAALEGWKRLPDSDSHAHQVGSSDVDLVQNITTDCSVVASLCAIYARLQKLESSPNDIFQGAIYPQNSVPRNGKYILKLHFNGCFRKVVVDDRLPYSQTSRSLHVVDRSTPRNILPALIEKAYLKVRGGYDFPGSNCGTDLWALTGWIPEQLFLQSEDIIPHAFWKRIFNAFNYGDVLITLGTHGMTQEEEKLLGLAGEHAYAVIDMEERDDRQLLLIKNPWSKGGTWTGYIDHNNPSIRSQPQQTETSAAGTFWMDLYNVIQYFHTIYLNWNPGLFTYRRELHFTWDLINAQSSTSLIHNPQFLLTTAKGGTVFVILTRHFCDDDTARASPSDHQDQLTGFLSLSAFKATHRLITSKRALHRSSYIDAPNVLLRFESLPNTSYTILVSESDLPLRKTDFTLSAFSTTPSCHFIPSPDKYSQGCLPSKGAWTQQTAAGNINCGSYDKNPQFSVKVNETSDMAILLESDNADFPVHVKLVWANGKRVQLPLTAKDVYGDSGEYTRGCALAEIPQILPGTYTIACSTFEAGQVGGFTLHVKSSSQRAPFIQQIRDETGGMLSQTLPTATFSHGVDRLLAPITVTHATRLHFRLELLSPKNKSYTTSSPFKVSVEYGQGPNKSILLSSGEFSHQSLWQTSFVDVNSRMSSRAGPGVWLVIKRASGSRRAGVEEMQVAVRSDVPGVEVGPWGRESELRVEELEGQMARNTLS